MKELVTGIIEGINSFVWGPVMMAAILFSGILLTFGTGFFQIRRFKLWINSTLLAIFKNKKVRKSENEKSISQFQSMATALAGTMGTGNIVGVATALTLGGAGAILWMWISALFGMMTKYAENVLGIKYRYKDKDGSWKGGAMIYLEKGLGMKWLGVLFAIFCVFASFGIGNMTQANSMSHALNETFNAPFLATGIITAVLVGFAIIGGIKRISSITEKIIPFISVVYILGCLIILTTNFAQVPDAFKQIFKEGLNFKAAGGGIAGFAASRAVHYGISRGIFSNEAGLGSSVVVHAESDVKEAAEQGMWGIFEVFFDTIVVCTLTALCILSTGAMESGKDGAALTIEAFARVFGSFGNVFISISIVLFAFATLLGWSYYGQRTVEYLVGKSFIPAYKLAFVVCVVVGCCMELQLAWRMSDAFNGLMAAPNLIGVIFLSNEVFKETNIYLVKKGHKKPPSKNKKAERLGNAKGKVTP